MKQIITALLIIASVVSLIAIVFTINQVNSEEQRLQVDLQYRSTLLAESFKETIEPNFLSKSEENLQAVVERFANRERFAGLAIYDHKGEVTVMSSSLPKELGEPRKIAADAMDEDRATGDFRVFKGEKFYLLAVPLHDEKSVVGSLMIAQNASYIDGRLKEIWRNNLARLLLQISLLAAALFLIFRWLILSPVKSLAEILKSVRTGEMSVGQTLSESSFFKPIAREVTNIRNSLLEARVAAKEEARFSLEKLDSPWTGERLKEFVKDTLKNRAIVMISNREPYVHTKDGNKISYHFPASGMATAIEPVMRACGGKWIAHGSGNADQLTVDKDDRLAVPPDDPKYTLRRVWLSEKEEEGYYNGFSNEGLWALCHTAHTRPIFRKEDWEEYKKVNGKFAEATLLEIKDIKRPIILIQDFHFTLLPRMIKKARPDAVVGLFWHVPWVSAESFSICPWKKEILNGMLGADLVGFHTQLHCNNFIETVSRELESLIDLEQFTITRQDHLSYIKPFPISIAFTNGNGYAADDEDKKYAAEMLKELGIKTKYVGLGVDRMDYTKGILERFKAIEIFLNKYPSYREKFTFIQIAAPSRTDVKKYRDFAEEVGAEAERINELFKSKNWKPILLIPKYFNQDEVYRFYQSADLCLVTSLHDGMNLVAKEFAAARNDEKGVLILSQFTGAAKEMKDALIVNPYNGEQTAEAIFIALNMPLSQQKRRMKKLRDSVRNYNVYRWSAELLKNLSHLG